MEQQAPRRGVRWLENRIRRKGPRYAVYAVVAFWVVGVVLFAVVERLVDPKTFYNVWIGMWWGVQTVTTVGYGDIVPASTAGKAIASVLMLGGLSLFAVVTGAITSGFVAQAQAQRRAAEKDPVMSKLEEMAAQLEAMKAQLARLERSSG